MMKFISLGSGSSGNCYCLATEDTCILIDAGISFKHLKRMLKEKNICLDDIDAVFITHDHADHIKAVGDLANNCNIPIYATEAVHLGINRNYCVTSKLTAEHQRIIQKMNAVKVGNICITSFDVPHDSSDCVGYRIESEDVVFCIITDVGHVTEIIRQQVGEANYLVLEANYDEDMLMMGPYPAYLKGRIRGENGHLSNKDSARLVAEYASPSLKQIWLCHLSEENNHPELARKTYESVLREYGLIVGLDFKVDVLKRKVPSEIIEIL